MLVITSDKTLTMLLLSLTWAEGGGWGGYVQELSNDHVPEWVGG